MSTLAGSAPPESTTLADVLGGELRYSTVWEDHLLVRRALEAGPGDELLMVASAGCNVLDALLGAPRRIVAVDFNIAQTALVELKLAAFATLSHPQVLDLLGVTARSDRPTLYDLVRSRLSMPARAWWDAHPDLLASGIERGGRLERYIAGFRDAHLAAPSTRAAIERLLDETDPTLRARLLDERILTTDVVAAFRGYFTRESLGARGRSEAQCAHIGDVDVAGWFLGRLRWACTALPTRGNFYLRRFLLGDAAAAAGDETALPPYLRRAAFPRLRALASRVEVVNEELGTYVASRPAGAIDHAALSDVFEYLAPSESDALFAAIARVLRVGGHLAYWNLFVPRSRPLMLAGRLRPLDALSRALFARDRAWFYSAFHVEERCDA